MSDLQIERFWLDNELRNYNYIAVCKQSNRALVIDPLDVDTILNTINRNQWRVDKIVNTHDHSDHIEGNAAVVKATGAKIYAPHGANIDNVDHRIGEGDVIELSDNVVFSVLDTPGHRPNHISLLSNTQVPELFCGDTIFNAGAGNVYSGDAAILYATFVNKLSALPDETRLYPGHDYFVSNLEFSLSVEENNRDVERWLEKAKQLEPAEQIITNLGDEKKINPFMRLEQTALISKLKQLDTTLPINPTPKEIFLKLRELRNNW